MILMRYYFLIFFIKTHVVGTHLNCLDLKFKVKQLSPILVQAQIFSKCLIIMIYAFLE